MLDCVFNKQVNIVIATMALHNYKRRHSERDRHFDDPEDYSEESDIDDDEEEDRNHDQGGMEALRNSIMMNAYFTIYFLAIATFSCDILDLDERN